MIGGWGGGIIFGESKQEGSHSICCYLCSSNAIGRGGALFSLPLSPASLSFHWSSSLPLALAHPSSLSIPVSDAVIQSDAVIREGGFTETHTLCVSGESWWVRGPVDNSPASIFFPLLSEGDDFSLKKKKSHLARWGLTSLDDRLANKEAFWEDFGKWSLVSFVWGQREGSHGSRRSSY